MRRAWLLLGLPALLAAGPATPDPVGGLAGRYSKHFRNGMVDGATYESDDVVEIVPVNAGHAYLNFNLQFYNGHSCHLSGVAGAAGDALIYRAPSVGGGPACRLVVRRRGDALVWSDGGSCKQYCGARGSFINGSLPWRSKRPISYMTRLKDSWKYQRALSEWKR